MILPVYIIGSPVLRKRAMEIGKNYENLPAFVDDMFETMYHSDGIGLAAPQVGKSVRLFVLDGSPLEEDEPGLKGFKKIFINPEILEEDGDDITMSEGCISIPEIREEVTRPEIIRVKYFDEKFALHQETFAGMAARIIQHEYDHLEGVLFVDRVSPIRRRLIKGRLNAVAKGKFRVDYRVKIAH